MNDEILTSNEIQDHKCLDYLGPISRDEAYLFAFELAFKDRMSGLNEIDYISRFDLVHDKYLNWGMAVTLVAKYIFFQGVKNNSRLN